MSCTYTKQFYICTLVDIDNIQEYQMSFEFKDQLNESQFEAASTTEGPLLILAGAGSGKTRVITYRIGNLIQNMGVPPYNIMAVTFTNKAAGEMRERISNLIGPAGEQVFMKTFHSACVYILRRYGSEIGIPSNFTIYDSKDQEQVVKEILLEKKLDPKKIRPASLVSKISEIKDKAELDNANISLLAPDNYPFDFSDFYENYNIRLETRNALDFTDLLIKTVHLLKECPLVLETLQNKWRYIMIDEYQDTNKAQYLITKYLAAKFKNICVVGDDDQSIYSWRGADIRNILDFEKDYPDAKVVKLEHNYRSTAPILDAAHCVIQNNNVRKDKKLIAARGDGENPIWCNANNEYGESEFIVNKIKTLKQDDDLKNKDFAIFYRTNAQSRVFEDHLRKANIPYRIIGGLKFYDRKEIKDITAYLKFVVNPFDTVALFRIINSPARGIGNRTIEKIKDAAYENQMTEWEVIDKKVEIGGKYPKGLMTFRTLVQKAFSMNAQICDTYKLPEFVKDLVDMTGYRKSLESDDSPESKARIENIDAFLTGVAEFEDKNPGTKLEEFLQEISLMTSQENPVDENAAADPENTVTLMTVHNAKGLEYPVVFLSGMEEGTFPHWNSSDTEEGIEEERRLAYVGITRAMNKLFITSAEFRRSYQGVSYKEPSRFLNEIDSKLLFCTEYTEGGNTLTKSTPYGKSSTPLDRKKTRTNLKNYFEGRTTETDKKAAKFFENINQKEETTTEGDAKFKPRDMVSHPKYGTGYVLTVEGKGDNVKLTINFNSAGIKSFLEKYTPLEKI